MYTGIGLIMKKKNQETAQLLANIPSFFCTLREKIKNIPIVARGIIIPKMAKFGNLKSFE